MIGVYVNARRREIDCRAFLLVTHLAHDLVADDISLTWGKNTQPKINHENTGGFVTNTYPILAGVGRCFHLAQSRNLAQPAGLMPGGIFHSANSIDQSVVPPDRREFGIFTIMSFVFQPGQLYMVILGGWMNRQQQEVIEDLQTENRVLKEQLGAKRIMLNDDQRRRLGVKGKILGRKLLEEFGTLFAPDTILRWHRQLVAQKWDYSDRKKKEPGRPRIRQVIVDLTLQFAKENPTWGFDRIQGELAKVGYQICDTTVSNILKEHGIEPAPTRKRTGSWQTFLEITLGRDGSDRLYFRGSLDQRRAGDFLSAIRHGTENTSHTFRRLHDKS